MRHEWVRLSGPWSGRLERVYVDWTLQFLLGCLSRSQSVDFAHSTPWSSNPFSPSICESFSLAQRPCSRHRQEIFPDIECRCIEFDPEEALLAVFKMNALFKID